MRLRLIRHATLVIQYADQMILVDPMLDDAGARGPIQNSPNPTNNPLVPLPVTAEEVVKGIDVVLVTHTHSDHWDATAERVIPKNVPLLGQVEDEAKFRSAGFSSVRAIRDSSRVKEIEILRTGGQHGTGEIAKMLAPVSGFGLRATGEPTLYITGDTIWCPDVGDAITRLRPEIIVVNTGAARFLEGDPITMIADDVIEVCRAAPNAQVVAVHMEAINHCLLTRADLAFQLEAARVIGQVAIPNDGDWVNLKA
jgi:L-ascorbate metabolism protein UlaG (beta-lactamase superfamily)